MRLTTAQQYVLQALIEGCTLKSHRYLDGAKVYKLHPLDGPSESIDKAVMDSLKQHQLIDSNKKFPAATYLLTEKGKELAVALTENESAPLSPKNFGR